MYYGDYNRPPEEEQQIYEAPAYKVSDAPPPKKKKGGIAKWIALCLVFALVGGIGGGFAVNSLNSSGSESTIYQGDRLANTVNLSQIDTGTALSLSELYAKCAPSTVGITVEHTTTNYFGQNVAQAAAGSGFVITSDGYIITNFHVIYNDTEGTIANSIQVTFMDGTVHDATYVGGEQENDLAVLKIEAAGLTPVVIGKSSSMNVGEQVAAIGNPLGELTFSLTDGIISALDRSITTSDGTVMNMVQTNTAINPGNSGGPMFNMYGEVIGITTSKYTTTSSGTTVEGLGFIIPIDDVVEMISDVIEHGYVTGKPYLGVVASTVTESEASRYGFPIGANILGVAEGSCAEAAGLNTGDIITGVNGISIDGQAALVDEKNKLAPGDEMVLTVSRSGETLTLTLILDESTPEMEAKTSALRDEINAQQSQQQQQGGYSYWPFW